MSRVVAATLGEWSLLLGGIALLVTSLGGAAAAVITARGVRHEVREIKKGVDRTVGELRTLNGSTVGELADAIETRRVAAIPPIDRTAAENEHIAMVPPDPGSVEEDTEADHDDVPGDLPGRA